MQNIYLFFKASRPNMDAIQRIEGTPSTEVKRRGGGWSWSLIKSNAEIRISETRTPLFQHAFIACRRVNFYLSHFGATWDVLLYDKNKGIYTNTHNKGNTNNLFLKSENIFSVEYEAETKIIWPLISINTHNKGNANNLFLKSENIFSLEYEAETKIIWPLISI
jgi:hypothetical protein